MFVTNVTLNLDLDPEDLVLVLFSLVLAVSWLVLICWATFLTNSGFLVGSPGVQPISNPRSMTPVNDRRRCEIIQDPKSQVTLHSFLLRLPCPRPLEALANIVDVWRTRYPNLYFTLTFSLCYLALACPPLCICGHSEAAHALAQRVTYPPRGRCVDSGCIGFQTITFLLVNPGHTPCRRPGCGQPYYAHDPPPDDPTPSQVPTPAPPSSSTLTLPLDPTMSLVPSMTSTVRWAQAPLAGQTTDGRRRAFAKHHRTWGPSTGASMPRGTQRPFTSNTRAVSQPNKPPTEISFAIWPFSPFSHQHADPEYPDLYPTDPRLIGSEGSAWATVFNDFNLLFKFESEIMNTIHAQRFESFAWTLFSTGIKPKSGFQRKISVAGVRWYEFTVTGLAKQKSLPDPVNPAGVIYFIGLKHGPLQGPLPAGRIPHACFPLGVQYALECKALILSDPIDCLDICPSSRSLAPEARTLAPARAAGAPELPLFDAGHDSDEEPIQSLPLFDAAHDSDEEATQIRQAMALSLADNALPASPEAGPSNAPMPALLGPCARPASLHTPSPPSIRRRLNTAIDLTLSPLLPPPSRLLLTARQSTQTPSPSPAPAILPTYTNVRAWSQALKPKLATGLSVVTALTVKAAVTAFLQTFESFYGRDPYVAPKPVNAVSIDPPGEFGLLAKDRSWKSGTAIGHGIGEAIMNELMNAVFNNSQIWKNMGDSYVINVSPAGIMPDAGGLRLLRAHGYACRLYIVLQGALPPLISVLFAFSLLTPGHDNDVISNSATIRMLAPHQVPLLRRWPDLRSDFLAKEKDPELMELVNNHFNLLTLFSNSSEISAFAEGFNGPISPDSDAKLSDTFGASLKTLILKMSAGRLRKPDDVVKRLAWKSTGGSELREDERLYRAVFIRYLNGRGIVDQKQLPRDNLTEHEKSIPEDHPLMVFMKDFGPPPDGRTAPDPNNADPAHNPDHWSNHILPVRGHTCFDGVDLPLLGPSKLLKQPVPNDDDASTDFDAYQYIMYRPATVFQEFGGII
ncbi:hypothetical protein B0H14DRAFT_2601563 [Mycena olivaceomarginata]|nr:hypothetical protein B0H14DRAFT_2601563 [Mycena olivaceomarginata]